MPKDQFTQAYSDGSFWDKVKGFGKAAGETVLEPALKLYYSASDPDTPAWAKAAIYGALGYFIFPIDAVPDIAPIIGYTDDLGVLAAAGATTAAHIKDEHTQKAKDTVKQWLS